LGLPQVGVDELRDSVHHGGIHSSHGATASIDHEGFMTPYPTTQRIPPVRRCGSYRRGHDVHFIQARLTWELSRDEHCTVRNVADDGTITFTSGATVWNHDPERLRTILAQHGSGVLMSSYGVLRVPHDGGGYCFSVSSDPDPCRPETAEHRPCESLVDELLRRGGSFAADEALSPSSVGGRTPRRLDRGALRAAQDERPPDSQPESQGRACGS
jgi:hypothetical protein